MDNYYQKGFEKFFNVDDKNIIIDIIRFLLYEGGKNIKLKTFLNKSDNIPFKFFKFQFKDEKKIKDTNNQENIKKYFKLFEINLESDIYLEYQSDYVINDI